MPNSLGLIVRPNAAVTKSTTTGLIIGWIVLLALFWLGASFMPDGGKALVPLLPGPGEVTSAMAAEWKTGAAFQMMTSLVVSLEALFFATLIGLGLSYLATIPLFRIPVDWIGKLRFLSLAGLIVVFLNLAPSGHILKVSVLTFAIVVFLITDMRQVIDDIPQAKFDHARTLGLSQWQVLREVVIRGTLADAFESVRMNAAMAWMMLTMVEGLSRSEGGIGVLLLSLQRSGNYAAIFAIQLMIFIVGIGQDRLIKALKAIACPYTVR